MIIGTFVLVCFIVWFVRHMMKKSKAKKGGGDLSRSSSTSSRNSNNRWPGLAVASQLASKLPFLRNRQQRKWEDLDNSRAADFPQDYKNASMASNRRVNELDGTNNAYQQPPVAQLAGPPAALRLPSMNLSGSNAMNDQFFNSITMANQDNSARTHQPAPSFSSTEAVQFGGTLQTNPSNGTYRSLGDDSLYSQPGLVRQPSDAYNPARRQLNRASELSSLSSGFGDGDFAMPNGMMKPPASVNPRQSTNIPGGRFSFMSQGRRDTVYTQSSEDSPPRFRSVNSWVDQQSGRIKRARQREEDQENAPPVPMLPGQTGVPGIHNPPAEQSFNMMMQDDEVPRRVEDTMAMR